MMELRVNIPTKLSELTADQLLYISRLYLMQYSETEFLVKALFYLSGIKLSIELKSTPGSWWCSHSTLDKSFILDADQIAEMKRKVEFLLQPDEVHPLPWIGLARACHFRLYNASFEQYLMAENFYFAFIQTRNEEHLDNLISCLYRRTWQRWNADKIQERASQFSKVDPAVKNTVFIWYIGFRSYIPNRCKSLFSGKKSKRPFNPREYVNGMIHQLTNGDITIKDKLLKMPVWDALDELEQRAIDFELANSKS